MSVKFTDLKSAELFKIFAEEIRLKIISRLIEREKHVNEISKEIDIVQPLVSHHLRILKEKNIVKAARKGNKVIYSLNEKLRKNIRKDGKYILDLGCCEITIKE